MVEGLTQEDEWKPTSAWVLGGCDCEPCFEHCGICDERRRIRAAFENLNGRAPIGGHRG